MRTPVFLFMILLAVFVDTSTAFAYFTTKQEAFTVNQKYAVFLIDFSFGHADHSITIPLLASTTETRATTSLSYQVLNSTESVAQGAVTGIVIGDVPLAHGVYMVPKGKAGHFTLLAVYTKSPIEPSGAFHMSVSGLPFTFDGTQELQLNPSELQYYRTPSVPLK